MSKTAVYRWRLNPGLRQRLEAAARAEAIGVARLLDRIVRTWLAEREAEEQLTRAEAAKRIGSISSGDRYGSERVKERVRARLPAAAERAPGSLTSVRHCTTV
jgi:hypothetical protein